MGTASNNMNIQSALHTLLGQHQQQPMQQAAAVHPLHQLLQIHGAMPSAMNPIAPAAAGHFQGGNVLVNSQRQAGSVAPQLPIGGARIQRAQGGRSIQEGNINF